MIKTFSAEQYLKLNNIDSLTPNLCILLDQVISLEVAIFHMRNTSKPKFCDGFNVDTLINLRQSKIDYFESLSKLTYYTVNDFFH